MSEMSDRMKQLDEQYKKTISLAMDKDQPGPADGPGQPHSPLGSPSPKGKDFSLPMVALYILCGLTIAVVVIYSSINAAQTAGIRRAGDQLEILLEDQADELQDLKRHVEAVEAEFRRAFKKDRDEMAAMKETLLGEDAALADTIEKFSNEIRADVLKYKTSVTDNEALSSQISRDYDGLMSRFSQVQDEFKQLRARVLDLTAPQMPE